MIKKSLFYITASKVCLFSVSIIIIPSPLQFSCFSNCPLLFTAVFVGISSFCLKKSCYPENAGVGLVDPSALGIVALVQDTNFYRQPDGVRFGRWSIKPTTAFAELLAAFNDIPTLANNPLGITQEK